ncbi:MAG: YigZ family protein [Clostridia bacterium]|nr:YigZ family protein [Clostridia bacterium]
MEDYLTIDGEAEYGFEVHRSRFLCRMAHTECLVDGLEFVADIKKRYNDATHNCYAAIGSPLSNEQKFSDDGEPSGTAGQPILNVLVKNRLYCVTAVVTRYFGGIKLGAGGLVSAYTKAVAECVSQANIIQNKWSAIYRAELSYSEYKTAEKRLREEGVKIEDIEYGEGVKLRLAVPQSKSETLNTYLSALTQGGERHAFVKNEYVYY